MSEIKINIPEGYEIDKENSTFECIKFKRIVSAKCWQDIQGVSGFVMGDNSCIIRYKALPNAPCNRNVFIDKKYAKSALAMAQISQLMPYYGGEVTKEEWGFDSMLKHCIIRHNQRLNIDVLRNTWRFLAFHTEKQARSFLTCNEDLVGDYYML